MRQIVMKYLLILALLMSSGFTYADTVSPFIIFNNGLRLDSNELADVMDLPKGLGYMFDGDAKTNWRPQKRDERYGAIKRVTLRLRSTNTAITSLTLHTDCGNLKHVTLSENNKKFADAKSEALKEIVLKVDGKKDFLINFDGDEVCISDMKIYAGKNELTKDTSFIVSGGGGYPDVFFFAKYQWVDTFKRGNASEFYFIENGNYACFILSIEPGPLSGIRIFNTKTLAMVDALKGEYLVPPSIKWNGRTVSGILVKPKEKWAEEQFSVKVKFP